MMHDHTAFHQLDKEQKENIGLHRANACISNSMMIPLRTINQYVDILMQACASDAKLCELISAI